jgi:hypothetical protein
LTEVSLVLVSHFAQVARVEIGGIHIGECVSCMLDHDNFRRFVVPGATTLGHRFSALRFHSCGRSDHLIGACKAIDGLGSIDVGGETSVAVIREQMGREFPIGIAPLVEHMRANSTDEILRWFRQIRDDNDDGDLTIGFHLEADFNVDTIRALHQEIVPTG